MFSDSFKAYIVLKITYLFSLMYVLNVCNDYFLWLTYLNGDSFPVIMYQLCGIVISQKKTQCSSWVDVLTSLKSNKQKRKGF